MALSEFVAIETAYLALQQLDPGGRQRALHWLTEALSVAGTLPKAPVDAQAELDGGGGPTPEGKPRRSPEGTARTRAAAKTTGIRNTTGAGKTTGAPATAAAATGRTGRTIRAAKSVSTGDGDRAYRRMPDASDVLSAYQQVGSVSGLAEYYGVPRHTVQGWARRLRREGYDIGRSA